MPGGIEGVTRSEPIMASKRFTRRVEKFGDVVHFADVRAMGIVCEQGDNKCCPVQTGLRRRAEYQDTRAAAAFISMPDAAIRPADARRTSTGGGSMAKKSLAAGTSSTAANPEIIPAM